LLASVHLSIQAVYRCALGYGMIEMLRILALCACALAILIVPTSMRWLLDPVPEAPFTVFATPLNLNESNPNQKTIGDFQYLGGWSLMTKEPAFGSFSGFVLSPSGFDAVSDRGTVLQFRDGVGTLRPLPSGCGIRGFKTEQDAESLARDPETGTMWIGLEGRHSICAVAPGGASRATEIRPASMKRWWPNGGAEALLYMAHGPLKGGLFVFAEQAPKRTHEKPLLFFPKAPVAAETPHVALQYLPPDGFVPADAVALKDGRILILNRRFTLPFAFATSIVMIDKPDVTPGALWKGREIARFEPPLVTENFEGIAIKETPEETIVWLLSDDNFFFMQKTLLLKLRLLD
jgi:hypothetical protein